MASNNTESEHDPGRHNNHHEESKNRNGKKGAKTKTAQLPRLQKLLNPNQNPKPRINKPYYKP